MEKAYIPNPELEKKMIICGYTDYPEYCDKFIKTILSSREK